MVTLAIASDTCSADGTQTLLRMFLDGCAGAVQNHWAGDGGLHFRDAMRSITAVAEGMMPPRAFLCHATALAVLAAAVHDGRLWLPAWNVELCPEATPEGLWVLRKLCLSPNRNLSRYAGLLREALAEAARLQAGAEKRLGPNLQVLLSAGLAVDVLHGLPMGMGTGGLGMYGHRLADELVNPEPEIPSDEDRGDFDCLIVDI